MFFSSTSGFVETVDDIKTDSLEVLPSVTELLVVPTAASPITILLIAAASPVSASFPIIIFIFS